LKILCDYKIKGAQKSVTNKLQRVLNAAARVVSGTRKFNHGLTQLLHADLHWLDVPERINYKLCMMMRQCQDGTAPQYLVVHWSPVSETASRQHLRSAASHQHSAATSADHIWRSGICCRWSVDVELTAKTST